jgi:hypothetical protein
MIKNLLLMWAFILPIIAYSAETIKIYSPYNAAHSGTPALLKVIEVANEQQTIYKFVPEFKPGGNQIIAVKSLDANSLAIIAPAYVENVLAGKLNEADYVPVHAFGNACWAVVTNKPLNGQKEFVVGGVGIGNATHLTAIALGDKFKFNVRYVVFKSNFDAMVNMTGDNGVEFVIDRFEGYENLKSKNPKMTMVAASCPRRLPQSPTVKTLKEMGITAPYIFNITIAHKDMPLARKIAISKILTDATLKVGSDEIYHLSAMRPPIFDGLSADDFYAQSVFQIKTLQDKYKAKIDK